MSVTPGLAAPRTFPPANNASVPFPHPWPGQLPFVEKEHVRELCDAFSYAEELEHSSEFSLYEGVNNGFEYPVELYMNEYCCWLHWIAQGLVRLREEVGRLEREEELSENEDEEILPPPKPKKQRMTKNSIAARTNGYYDRQETSKAKAAPHDPTVSQEELAEIRSHRLTDFLLAISKLGPDGEPMSHGVVAVVEAKRMPPESEPYTTEEEECAAVEKEIAQALPQLLQQAMHALNENLAQSSVWGIVVVGRCCQFFRFHRSTLDKLPVEMITEKLPVEDATKYATVVGGIHRMIDPGQECYAPSFIQDMDKMMKWAKETLL